MNENDVVFLNSNYTIEPLAGFDEMTVVGSVVGFTVGKVEGELNPTLLTCVVTNSDGIDVTANGDFYITNSTGNFYITVNASVKSDLYTVSIYDEDVLVYQNLLEVDVDYDDDDVPSEKDPIEPGDDKDPDGESPVDPVTPVEPTEVPGYVKYILQKLDHYGLIMNPKSLPKACSILREQGILNGILTSIFMDSLTYQQKEDSLNCVLDRFATIKGSDNGINYLSGGFPYRGINHLKNKTYEERKRFMLMFEFCIMFAKPEDRETAYLKYNLDNLLSLIPKSEHDTVKKLIDAIC